MATDTAWMADAACKDMDVDLFFGDADMEKHGGYNAQTAYAQSVCRNCPVRRRCEQWAADTDQQWGVWGGVNRSSRNNTPLRPPAYCEWCKRAFETMANNTRQRYCTVACRKLADRGRVRTRARV